VPLLPPPSTGGRPAQDHRRLLAGMLTDHAQPVRPGARSQHSLGPGTPCTRAIVTGAPPASGTTSWLCSPSTHAPTNANCHCSTQRSR
jgi:hypothetical protein